MTDSAAHGSFDNPLLTSLEQIVEEKAAEWKLVHATYSDSTSLFSEWSRGEDKAVIQIARMGSAEQASSHLHLFAWHIPLKPSDVANMQRDPDHFQIPQPVLADAKLPNVGDENYVWSKYDQTASSLIKLRSGNVIVHVDGSSFGVAEMFARLLAEHLRAA